MDSKTIRGVIRDSLLVGLTEDGEYAIKFETERKCSDDSVWETHVRSFGRVTTWETGVGHWVTVVLWTDFDTFVRAAHSDVACVLLEMKDSIAHAFEQNRQLTNEG